MFDLIDSLIIVGVISCFVEDSDYRWCVVYWKTSRLPEFGKGVDVVIHLAAKSDVSESVIHPEITSDVNVRGTQNVLQCCIKNNIKKIIFASSAAVYGECKDNPIAENSTTNPLSPYGQSKLDAEKIIHNVCMQNNINHVILRIFNVYGKGQNVSMLE